MRITEYILIVDLAVNKYFKIAVTKSINDVLREREWLTSSTVKQGV